MSSVVIAGDSSGTITLQAPSVAGTTILTLPTTSGTLVTTGGGSTGSFTTLTSTGASSFATSSGNVGIGTSSPSVKLQVNSNGEALRLVTSGTVASGGADYQTWVDSTGSRQAYLGFGGANNTFQMHLDPYGPITFDTNNSERMRIDGDGNVAVGTSTALLNGGGRGNITINGSTSSILTLGVSGTAKGYVYVDANHMELDAAAGYIQFNTGSASRMSLDASGNLAIGYPSPGNVRVAARGADSSTGAFTFYATNSGGGAMWGIRNDNYFFAPSIANYATSGSTVVLAGQYVGYLSSSIRFKKDVVDYDKGIDVVKSLRPVYYRSSKPNQDGEYDERTYAGFIAEEVKELGLEEFIDYDHEGEVTSLKYGQMTAILCKAIQELNAKVTALEAQLGAK